MQWLWARFAVGRADVAHGASQVKLLWLGQKKSHVGFLTRSWTLLFYLCIYCFFFFWNEIPIRIRTFSLVPCWFPSCEAQRLAHSRYLIRMCWVNGGIPGQWGTEGRLCHGLQGGPWRMRPKWQYLTEQHTFNQHLLLLLEERKIAMI